MPYKMVLYHIVTAYDIKSLIDRVTALEPVWLPAGGAFAFVNNKNETILAQTLWQPYESTESKSGATSAPVCPICGEVMVRAHEQNEEGDWGVRWLCSCLPDPEMVKEVQAG